MAEEKNPVKVAAGQKGGRSRSHNKRVSSSYNLRIARAKRWPGRQANVPVPPRQSELVDEFLQVANSFAAGLRVNPRNNVSFSLPPVEDELYVDTPTLLGGIQQLANNNNNNDEDDNVPNSDSHD